MVRLNTYSVTSSVYVRHMWLKLYKKYNFTKIHVLKLYYGLDQEDPLTLEEIGEKFKLTRERVRQIKEKAIKRIQYTTRCKILKTYLG